MFHSFVAFLFLFLFLLHSTLCLFQFLFSSTNIYTSLFNLFIHFVFLFFHFLLLILLPLHALWMHFYYSKKRWNFIDMYVLCPKAKSLLEKNPLRMVSFIMLLSKWKIYTNILNQQFVNRNSDPIKWNWAFFQIWVDNNFNSDLPFEWKSFLNIVAHLFCSYLAWKLKKKYENVKSWTDDLYMMYAVLCAGSVYTMYTQNVIGEDFA